MVLPAEHRMKQTVLSKCCERPRQLAEASGLSTATPKCRLCAPPSCTRRVLRSPAYAVQRVWQYPLAVPLLVLPSVHLVGTQADLQVSMAVGVPALCSRPHQDIICVAHAATECSRQDAAPTITGAFWCITSPSLPNIVGPAAYLRERHFQRLPLPKSVVVDDTLPTVWGAGRRRWGGAQMHLIKCTPL